MTEAFRGELFWADEHHAFSPVIVDTFEIPNDEEYVWIELHSSGEGRDDSGPYRIMARASLPERFEYHDHNGNRVLPIDHRQRAYKTKRCPVNRQDITGQAILELRFRLLTEEDEKRFCFLRLDWINAYDPETMIYSAQGLLEQIEAPYGENFSGRSISC